VVIEGVTGVAIESRASSGSCDTVSCSCGGGRDGVGSGAVRRSCGTTGVWGSSSSSALVSMWVYDVRADGDEGWGVASLEGERYTLSPWGGAVGDVDRSWFGSDVDGRDGACGGIAGGGIGEEMVVGERGCDEDDSTPRGSQFAYH
jgi:hypothetical protein